MTGGPNYKEATPALIICNRNDNSEDTEGNCRIEICPVSNHECPSCRGKGSLSGFCCGPEVCMKPIVMPCRLCNQTGWITDAKMGWVIRGRAMRTARVYGQVYQTLRSAAKERNISVVDYSRMEQGIIEPD